MGNPLRLLALSAVFAFAANAPAQSVVSTDWVRQFGAADHDRAFALDRDPAGRLHVGGTTRGSLYATLPNPFATGDAFVAKYDATGAFAWGDQFGTTSGENTLGIAADGAGNTFATGNTQGSLFATSLGGSDVFLRKYDATGGVAWSRQFGTTFSDQSNDATADAGGNVYVAGRFGASGFTTDAFLAKYSAAGTQLWLRQFGTTSDDHANAVKVDAAGNVIVAGRTGGNLAASPLGGGDAYLRKYDANGNVVWTRQLGSSLSDDINGLDIDAAGNIFAAGTTDGVINGVSGEQDRQAFVLKYHTNGDFSWVRQLDHDGEDFGADVSVDDLGNVLLAGTNERSTGASFLLASFDTAGNERWRDVFGTASIYEGFTGIVADGGDDVRFWTAGYTTGDMGRLNPGPGGEDALLMSINVPEPSAVVSPAAGALLLSGLRRVRSRA